MGGDTMPFRNPAGHRGLLNNVLALTNALAGFFESRAALFAKESKRALVHGIILASCLIGAAMMFAFGYVFLIASLVVGIAHWLGISWIWTALGAAVLHFIIALILVLIAKGQTGKSVFAGTTAELRKDREWLKNLNRNGQNTN